jgi:hypothetical protein
MEHNGSYCDQNHCGCHRKVGLLHISKSKQLYCPDADSQCQNIIVNPVSDKKPNHKHCSGSDKAQHIANPDKLIHFSFENADEEENLVSANETKYISHNQPDVG